MSSGLDGVVVADTVMSRVDGEAGRLVVRGWSVEDLAADGSFEEVVALLWTGDRGGADTARRELGEARARVRVAVPPLDDGIAALRAALAPLEGATPIELVAAAGEALVAFAAPGAPPADPSLGHAADLVRRLRGAPDPARARALDAYLVTVAEHGMNASTFAARVVASTGSDATSAVVAGLGALKGPLHGGAPGPVLDMLDAIGSPERAEPWLEAEIEAGRRIMGMGHRIYRVRDPRVAVLEAALVRLRGDGVDTGRMGLARAVEDAAERILARRKPDRSLKANVEFATAVLLDAVGLDRRAFTAAFAVGRIAGWLAHVDEQRRTGRLIRPDSRYVGPEPIPTA